MGCKVGETNDADNLLPLEGEVQVSREGETHAISCIIRFRREKLLQRISSMQRKN